MSQTTPPGRAIAIIRWAIGLEEAANGVVGDLCEEFTERLDRDGQAAASRWFWSQCLWIALVFRLRGGGVRGGTKTNGEVGGMGMGSWIRDLRIAARSLARRPGSALGVALTLGLGIGATTTIYSVVDGVILRPLPYDQPSTLVAIGAVLPNQEWVDEEAGLQDLARISMPNYRDLQERARSFENSATLLSTTTYLPSTGDGPQIVPAVFVSSELFEILGVAPFLGRTFAPDEFTTASEAVVMLSYGAWQRRYASDPRVLGQSLESVRRPPATIVGVPYGVNLR